MVISRIDFFLIQRVIVNIHDMMCNEWFHRFSKSATTSFVKVKKSFAYWPFMLGSPPMTGRLPTQRANDTKSAAMPWHHNGNYLARTPGYMWFGSETRETELCDRWSHDCNSLSNRTHPNLPSVITHLFCKNWNGFSLVNLIFIFWHFSLLHWPEEAFVKHVI